MSQILMGTWIFMECDKEKDMNVYSDIEGSDLPILKCYVIFLLVCLLNASFLFFLLGH